MLCRYFSSTGQCFYGEHCNFLHIAPQQQAPVVPLGADHVTLQQGSRVAPPAAWAQSSAPVGAAAGSSSSRPALRATAPAVFVPSSTLSSSASSLPSSGPANNNNNNVTSSSSPMQQGLPTPVMMAQPQPPPVAVAPQGPQLSSMISPTDPTYGYRGPASFAARPSLRDEWAVRRQASLQGDKGDPRVRALASGIGPFHSFVALDDVTRDTTITFFGYFSPVYRARHAGDGQLYALRTLKGFRPSPQLPQAHLLERWKQMRHPSIVSLREAFFLDGLASSAPGLASNASDLNMWFVYDYHPASKTLEALHLVPSAAFQTPFPEDVLWGYICQLVSALRAIHAQGLACRCIYPSKILVTGTNRLRINGCGMADMIHYDPSKLVLQQVDDLVSLGKLIMCLACRSAAAAQNVQRSLEWIGATYSGDVKTLVIFLLSKGGGGGYVPSIEDVVTRIAGRIVVHMDAALDRSDVLETNLAKELDNGRLFRIMTKLGHINERPEFGGDFQWSETGDRYLLKLFRDYVFHQVHEDGTPVISMGHVVDTLNRLDAGVQDKIPLLSRDHQTVLLCSFKDLKRCVDESFGDLVKKQQQNTTTTTKK